MRGLLALGLLILPLRAAQTPSEAALGYLRELAAGEAKGGLGKRTAISKDLTAERLEEIEEQVLRFRNVVEPSGLSVLAEKQDGDLAAVLVVQNSGPSAGTLEIFPMGVIRRGDQWLPAPVPGTFDSIGLSFDPALQPRARALEEWMMRSRSQELVTLQENSLRLWRESVSKALPRELLEKGAPKDLVHAFAAACQRGDQPAIFALLGGGDESLPENWEDLVKIVRGAFSDRKKMPDLWGLLARPQVLRVLVEAQGDSRRESITLVCLDPGPERSQRPRVLHFEASRQSSGAWRLEMPALLKLAVENPREAAALVRESASADSKLIALFPKKLSQQYPATPMAEVAALAEAFSSALDGESVEGALPLIDLPEDPQEAQKTIARLVSLWGGYHSPVEHRSLVPLKRISREDEVCGIYQFFSPAVPGDPQLVRLHMVRRQGGWLCRPLMRDDPFPAASALAEEADAAAAALDEDWSAGLITRVRPPLAPEGSDAEAAKALLRRWSEARAKGDVGAMIGMVAGIDDKTGMGSAVKNLGYEAADATALEVVDVYREGAWTGVAVKTAESPPTAGVYPVVATPAGPRILLELYIRAGEGSAAAVLNRRIFARTAEAFPGDARQKLEAFAQKYRPAIPAPATGEGER